MRTEIATVPIKGYPSTYLVGDVQRAAAVDFLRIAYGEGYLTAETHAGRTAKALRAVTHADLVATLDNLPDTIARQVPGEPDVEDKQYPQPPPWVRALRCLFIASATALTCTWPIAGTSGQGALSMAAALCGAIAGMTGIFSLAVGDGEF